MVDSAADRNLELLRAVRFVSRQKKVFLYTLYTKRVWYASNKNVVLRGR